MLIHRIAAQLYTAEALQTVEAGLDAGEDVTLAVSQSGRTLMAAAQFARRPRPTVYIVSGEDAADRAARSLAAYVGLAHVCRFPERKDYPWREQAPDDAVVAQRCEALGRIERGDNCIMVASARALLRCVPPVESRYWESTTFAVGEEIPFDEVPQRLVGMGYTNADAADAPGLFRVHGDTVEVFPAQEKAPVRIEFFGDEIDRISEINVLTGETKRRLSYAAIYPASHYATSEAKRDAALDEINREMTERVAEFREQGKFLEAQRIEERTKYDMEMIREIGFCSGIENYSRVLSGRPEGSVPFCLLDYFPRDFLLFVDESHVTLPQVRAMSGGDFSRKKNLIDYGFRLPSAYDNRPLTFPEFESKLNQVIYVSATPGPYEKQHSTQLVEQVIRPTGLLDPKIEVRPVAGQVDDLMGEIKKRTEKGERVLVTTLTKKMAEDLCEYLEMNLIKVRYIHHEVETMERQELLRDLRLGVYDVLVGINLLREGLDLPEVSLVAILDADKEGLLRSETSLVQTIGRAARNENGTVIMYADTITDSMRRAIDETERRRSIQEKYNKEHNIVPHTIKKDVRAVIEIASSKEINAAKGKKKMDAKEKDALIEKLTAEMKKAASQLDFERAAYLRDSIAKIKNTEKK